MSRIVFFLLVLLSTHSLIAQKVLDKHGVVIRSDTLKKNIYLCFTGHDFYEGFEHVLQVMKDQNVNASFFLTGDFVRSHRGLIKSIAADGHLIGAHSDKHLLYCDWIKRDSLLYAPDIIKADILHNLQALKDLDIQPTYFMPPYEWYNNKVVEIARELNQITVNFSPGTRSNADYTTPIMPNYMSSSAILESVYTTEKLNGLNGFHLLIHPGTSPLRKDKLYSHLEKLIIDLKEKGYQFVRF